jgi:LPS export ABC transporter permease LptG/LPS export ABC transporter permease LptF
VLGRRLDRYLIAEMVGPIALGFLVYTGMLLLRFLFQSAEMIIQRGLPVAIVGRLLVYTLPNIVVLTLPMSLLFGILIALGRLASDSELVALRSSGLSLTTLYRPILFVSLLFTAANAILMTSLLPRGNHALQQLRLEIITETVAAQVEPRVFYTDFEGLLLYVFERPRGEERWRGVFVAQSLPTRQQNEVTVAEWGRIRVDPTGERILLEMENAVIHEVDLGDPDRYSITALRRTEKLLEDRFASTQREKIVAAKGLRELTLTELAAAAADPAAGAEQRRLARVEIHKKFSIPAACLVFGVIALPLGFNNRRGGKAGGFVLSLVVFLVYYLMLNSGENAARFGRMDPGLAMWLPNLVLAAAGVILLVRRNRDKSLMLSRLDRWVREDLWGRLLRLRRWRKAREQRRRREAAGRAGGRPRGPGAEVVLRLPRLRLRVPNTLDRYVMRRFAAVFLLVMLSGFTLYVIADLGENLDDLLKHRVRQDVVVSYYKYLSLQIFYEWAPAFVLITTLVTFSLLGRSNEVTACKALGISVYRLAVPALAAAGLVLLLSGYLEGYVLPASNRKVAQLKDEIRGREAARTYRRADRQWLFGQDRFIYNYLHYDPKGPLLQRLQVFEFDREHRLVGRLYADRAVYRSAGEWRFTDGWVRRFAGAEFTGFLRFAGPRRVDYPETPEFFDSEIRPPDQMPLGELREYIAELKASGQPVPELAVELHRKLAWPVISLVMVLVALPFALRLGRGGALYGIGISIVLGFAYFAVFTFATNLGEAGALPPALAVWSPNLLFAMFAGWLFLGVRT